MRLRDDFWFQSMAYLENNRKWQNEMNLNADILGKVGKNEEIKSVRIITVLSLFCFNMLNKISKSKVHNHHSTIL